MIMARKRISTLGITLLWGMTLATVAMALFLVTSVYPAIGASSVDTLRGLVGDGAVAQVETVVFQTEDSIRSWEYRLGLIRPSSPWKVASADGQQPPERNGQWASGGKTPTQLDIPLMYISSPTPSATGPVSSAVSTRTPLSTSTSQRVFHTVQVLARISTPIPTTTPTPAPNLLPPPTPTARPTVSLPWVPAQIKMIGDSLDRGEGKWTAYMHDKAANIIAYRAFLHPDPRRPYATAAIVAFDLKSVRLHFVLGTKEPVSYVKLPRPGRIPRRDFQCGRLVAVFNGGFKARHGHFGAMVGGVTVLPPRQGLGTVAMYKDGRVRIGMWGTEVKPMPDISAWRQNGPLVIHNGKINPHTADYAPKDWGITVKGAIAVSRSALGISKDGRTLYYVAGDYLTLPVLARTLSAVGAYQAMQLDINKYWVHFDSIECDNGVPDLAPLLKSMRRDQRYLKRFWRDFFYITSGGEASTPNGKGLVVEKTGQ